MSIHIATMDEFRDYIKIELGSPVVCVEVSDQQITQSIFKSIDFFNRYNYTEGNYEDFIKVEVSAGVSAYDMPDDIAEAIEFIIQDNKGINTLFTNTHNLLYNEWVVNGNYPGGTGNYSGLELAQYDSDMMHLQDIKDKFGSLYRAVINPNTKQLNLVPTPQQNGTALVNVYRKTSAQALYNNYLVRELAVAYTMLIWGRNLKKTVIQLPGGGSVNGDSIYQDAVQEIEKIKEDIKGETEQGEFWIA
jgi:hypothetical protein